MKALSGPDGPEVSGEPATNNLGCKLKIITTKKAPNLR